MKICPKVLIEGQWSEHANKTYLFIPQVLGSHVPRLSIVIQDQEGHCSVLFIVSLSTICSARRSWSWGGWRRRGETLITLHQSSLTDACSMASLPWRRRSRARLALHTCAIYLQCVSSLYVCLWWYQYISHRPALASFTSVVTAVCYDHNSEEKANKKNKKKKNKK